MKRTFRRRSDKRLGRTAKKLGPLAGNVTHDIELPQGFHDPVTNARVDLVHAEIQRLAHSSPAVVGRDSKIRELKDIVGILRDFQFGCTTPRYFLASYMNLAIGCLVTTVAVCALNANLSATTALLALGILWLTGLVITLLDFVTTRFRLRRAEAMADSLVDGLGRSPSPLSDYRWLGNLISVFSVIDRLRVKTEKKPSSWILFVFLALYAGAFRLESLITKGEYFAWSRLGAIGLCAYLTALVWYRHHRGKWLLLQPFKAISPIVLYRNLRRRFTKS